MQGRRPVRLLGFGHTTDHLRLAAKPVPEFLMARRAAQEAYGMAGVGARSMDGIEVHDCFSISEIVAYEVLGLAEPGQGAKLVETGATAHPAVRELVTDHA